MRTPKTLSQAVDQAIAHENAEFIKTLCPFCMGTGTYYHQSDRFTCPNCKGSGLFKDLPEYLQKVAR